MSEKIIQKGDGYELTFYVSHNEIVAHYAPDIHTKSKDRSYEGGRSFVLVKFIAENLKDKDYFTSVIINLKKVSKIYPHTLKLIKKELRKTEIHFRSVSSFEYLENRIRATGNYKKYDQAEIDDLVKSIKHWAVGVLNNLNLEYSDSYRIAEVGNKRAGRKFRRDSSCCGSYEEIFKCPLDGKRYWLGCNYGH